MSTKEEINAFNELDFTKTMLEAASHVFKQNEKEYIGETRLVKLVSFGADEIGYPLTRGWFRYGYYAPESARYIKGLMRKHHKFRDFPAFRLRCSDVTFNKFTDVSKRLKPYLLRSREDFSKWVHEEMAPPPYRDYYKYTSLLDEMLSRVENTVSNGWQLDCSLKDLNDIMLDLEYSIDYVEDQKILNFFFEYINTWRMLILRIKKRGIAQGTDEVMSELLDMYKKFFLAVLSPYERTLKGRNAENVKIKFRAEISSNLNETRQSFDRLRQSARSQSLIATMKEIKEELDEFTSTWSQEQIRESNKIILPSLRP
jgi:hypothetical protein